MKRIQRTDSFRSLSMAVGFGVVASGVVACVLLVGCGGSASKDAESPATDEPANKGETSDDSWASEPEASDSDSDADAKEAEASTDSAVSPKEILIREGTAFLFDQQSSDAGIKAEEQCKKKSGDDVAKQAKCLSAALNKMPREGILFDEDDEGNWWYVRFGIEKNVKVEYNRVQVEVGEPQGNKLTLTTTGSDKAKRRKGTVPKELNFEVPDEYTVILHDPTRGRMEFEPKLGLFEEGQ